jgi:hypothetical protein
LHDNNAVPVQGLDVTEVMGYENKDGARDRHHYLHRDNVVSQKYLPVVEDSKADGIHVTANVLARIHVTAHEERYVVERCG